MMVRKQQQSGGPTRSVEPRATEERDREREKSRERVREREREKSRERSHDKPRDLEDRHRDRDMDRKLDRGDRERDRSGRDRDRHHDCRDCHREKDRELGDVEPMDRDRGWSRDYEYESTRGRNIWTDKRAMIMVNKMNGMNNQWI